MSLFLIQTIYQTLLPPGGFLLLLLLFNIYGYRKHWSKNWCLTIIILLFYCLSTRVGADLLVRPLEQHYQLPQQIQGNVLVMLGNGSISSVPGVGGMGQPSAAMSRSMLVAAQLQKETGLPLLVVGGLTTGNTISEAAIAKREFQNLGIPATSIYEEPESRNTAENARNAAKICQEKGWQQPILLTTALHLPRATFLFTREGLNVTPYPTHYRSPLVYSGPIITYMIPHTDSLSDSAYAIKEYIGIMAAKVKFQ